MSKSLIAGFAATVVVSVSLSFAVFSYWMSRPQNLMRHFYASEMATVVSPTTVKKYIDEKSDKYILVDLRSQGEYAKEHIKTAINIPAGSMNQEQLVAAFKKLPQDKEIIVHCYSAFCTLGRRVGKALSEHGIFVKEMPAGWNEWRYHWDLWNPGASIDAGKDYISTESAQLEDLPLVPCVQGEFGC